MTVCKGCIREEGKLGDIRKKKKHAKVLGEIESVEHNSKIGCTDKRIWEVKCIVFLTGL